MNLDIKKTRDYLILKPTSTKIDATVSTEFKGRVIDLIKQENYFILLNLSHVDFIDSSGLGSFVSILKMLKQNNGEIVLSNLKSPVLNLFNLTRMDSVFPICENEEEGIKALTDIKKSINENVIF